MATMRNIVKKSVLILGHKTSVSLEPAFWDEIVAIAEKRHCSLSHLITEVDQGRRGNLSSALRLLVLEELKKQA